MADNGADDLGAIDSTDGEEPTDEANEALELETFDLDGDGHVSVVEAERARLGLVDARLEEIAEEHGVKGAIAEAAHKLLDKFDND